ncbi:YkvA family protein [Haloflavibacter putidus]|uniref:DUF1232 domain-containing protein n=1 Tax=Haloflavibacter putidus TaxID=2576776 RepID=A0A507ZDQ4_9FLAO|nr:YkvA family protein [Haloflavibacter putidus]TQD34871.1 DUF1232 domain-containing protein [Haloflavibacter putidus]
MILDRIKDVITPNFVSEEAGKTTQDDLNKTVKSEKQIDRKISSAGMLEKYSELGKLMLKMLKDYKKGIYHNVPWFTIASIVVALLYVLNPFDIVPDFIPGIGYVDDLGVFTIALRFVETDLHRYLDWKLEED